MSFQEVRLDRLIEPAPLERAGDRDFPILSMTMHEGLIDQAAKFSKRVASASTADYRVVRRNQLVVGFPIDEGVLSFQDLYDEAIVSPAYDTWKLRIDLEIAPAYLERFLRSPRALAFYRTKLRGTTARRRTLPDDIFLNLVVPLPPLPEQRRIAEILDKADALRVKRRAALVQLDTLTQSIFLDMFGDPATNPKGWPVRTIGDLLESASYGTSEKSEATGQFAVLRMNNITRTGETDLSDLKYMDLDESERDRYLVRTGDVLFNRTNSPELVGKTAVFRGARPMAYAGYLIRLRVNRENDPEYLACFLNTAYSKRVLRGMCKSIIGMANINATEVQTIRIPQPPARIQNEFAYRVAGVEKLKSAHRTSLAEFDTLFDSLQYRAFKGEL
ncbi:MAG: restriction endonuclease subunit S [Anaerolineales bacterium]|nr:restriction endonuclease subunit S [Anaerolineales bacterium]